MHQEQVVQARDVCFVGVGLKYNLLSACRFEKLSEECVKNIQILKDAHAKGRSVPKCRTEERTFNTVKSVSSLTHDAQFLVLALNGCFLTRELDQECLQQLLLSKLQQKDCRSPVLSCVQVF